MTLIMQVFTIKMVNLLFDKNIKNNNKNNKYLKF
jgi:hypothetical protein